MKTAGVLKFSERVDRFLRWFVTVTPDEVAPRPPTPVKPKSRTVARRKPTHLRPHHSGPVRVAAKGKP